MFNRTIFRRIPQCHMCFARCPPLHCNSCHINLCRICSDIHISMYSIMDSEHEIVTIDKRKTPNYPKCSKHRMNECTYYCERCDIPVCETCLSTDHWGHVNIEFFVNLMRRKESLHLLKDLQELEESLYPKYQILASNFPVQRADLKNKSQKLKNAINKRGEVLHREIDDIIKKLNWDFDEMNNTFLSVIKKQEQEIIDTISEITASIAALKKLIKSKDICLVSGYKSRNAKFRNFPTKVEASLPTFTPGEINIEELFKEFGSLSAFSVITETHTYMIKSPAVNGTVLDVPQILKTIDTGSANLSSVALLSDEEFWTTGNDCVITLHNLQGELLQSVQTKSGIKPSDIAVTWNGDLVYVDPNLRIVNKVKNTEIQNLLTLREWRPRHVCCTFSGDLLVVMVSDDKQTKVARYSGSTEIEQSIQFNKKGEALYSSGQYSLYVNSNRNGDVCVADNEAGAVVVVKESGKFRFTYTGSQSFNRKLSFIPVGIATDSSSRILTSDRLNNCIHIIDQNGQFLRYIDNCDFEDLWGLCVDTKDNLFVAECKTGQVKKIQYSK